MILTGSEWQVLLFTLSISALALLLVVLPALLLAILTARWEHPVSSLLEAIATLPLAIPPVATGLFLLNFFHASMLWETGCMRAVLLFLSVLMLLFLPWR